LENWYPIENKKCKKDAIASPTKEHGRDIQPGIDIAWPKAPKDALELNEQKYRGKDSN
jgi:hypothetical protein